MLGTGYCVLITEIPARLGAVVAIFTVTVVVPAPAVIEAGLKLQLLRAGRFAHARVTVPVKAPAPDGTAENV